MELRLVESLSEAMKVRNLRNACREYLTNCTDHIGILRQALWYFRHYRHAKNSENYRLYLTLDSQGSYVGYGALSRDAEKLLITECVAAEYRNLGHGSWILDQLLRIAITENRDVIAEIWATNHRSILLHERAGFKLESKSIKGGKELQRYLFPSAISQPERSSVVAQGQYHYSGL
jgi:ribosomal protein S18 acetylase RimI-like enzyme